MGSTSQFMLWFRVAWACFLASALTYYLIRAWRRKTVTMVGSYGTRTVSRESFPVWYWGWMGFYFVVDLFFCLLVYTSIHKLLGYQA